MAKSGCKFIIIPLALAIFLIVLMIALSHRGVRYQMDVSGFLATEPEDGASVRLDGIIKDMQPTGASLEVRLCDAQSCVDALVPIRFGSRLKPDVRVIMSGIYRQQKLHVSDVLTRCHD